MFFPFNVTLCVLSLLMLATLIVLSYLKGRSALQWSPIKRSFIGVTIWLVQTLTAISLFPTLGVLMLSSLTRTESPPSPVTFGVLLPLAVILIFATEWVAKKAEKYGKKCRPQ